MTQRPAFMLSLAPLLLVLFIDSMGLSLLFPILNALMIDSSAHFFPANMSPQTREIMYGVTTGTYMLCWFFGAVVMGDLSDTIGRKKSLMICLIGTAAGYFLTGVSVVVSSLWLLIVARIIAGFTAGSQAIAQAAAVDLGDESHKARNISLVLAAISLGFVLGPVLGGVLSNHEWVSWFSFSTPFYFATGLSVLNMLLLAFLFEESFVTGTIKKIRWHRAITIFTSALRDTRLNRELVVLLAYTLGWAIFYLFLPTYVEHRFHYDVFKLSMFMMDLAAGFTVSTLIFVDFFSKRYSSTTCVAGGLVLIIVSLLSCLFGNEILLWLGAFCGGMAACVVYSVLVAVLSNRVSENEQGWVMGLSNAASALCFGLIGFFTGLMSGFGDGSLLLFAVAATALALVLLFALRLRGEAL